MAAMLVVPLVPSAAATHMSWYTYFPLEHDDQGRVDEPDFRTSNVLGPLVANCVVDFTPEGPGCTPDSALPGPGGQAQVLAPGCTDDAGRQPSGLCGLTTVGLYHPELQDPTLATKVPPPVGVQGMSGDSAPGRHTPTKGTQIRLLDIRAVTHTILPALSGSQYIDYNHKLTDSGARGVLAGVDPAFGSDVLIGDIGLWAFYGIWQDKNGNGIVDQLGPVCTDASCPDGGVDAENEWVWVGKCLAFQGNPPPAGQQYCKPEPNVQMPVWIWPGSHHAFCGGTLPNPVPAQTACYTLSADIPGKQVMCFLDVVAEGPLPIFCGGNLATFDLVDQDAYGDSLLGPQNTLWPDQFMDDRSGDGRPDGRQWVYGLGWPSRFYDQSVAVSTIIMGGPTDQPFDPEDRNRLPYDLSKFHSMDVDVFSSFSPVVESLLQTVVKPMARDNWVVLRNNFVPVLNTTDAYRHSALIDTSATTGPIDDQFINPGWSREPNTAQDQYPAASFNVFAASDPNLPEGEQRHRGWLNDYSAHKDTWHAFGDMQAIRMFYTNIAWGSPTNGKCLPNLCTTGGGTFTSNMYLTPRAPGEHFRTMEPGAYVLTGFVGAWRDRDQKVFDELVDVEATVANQGLTVKRVDYEVPADGWIGNIVNTTGTWKYRGYPGPGDEGAPSCGIAGVVEVRYFGVCNPYWSASTFDASPYAGPFQDPGVDIEDPQAGGGGEFTGIFPVLEQEREVYIYPMGPSGVCDRANAGTWTVPLFRWNGFDEWLIGDATAIVDYTGATGAAAVLAIDGKTGSGFTVEDVLVMPQGNLGLTVCTEMAEQVVVDLPLRGISVNEFVRDIDVYVPWAA